jgi:hypothetical protein
MSTATATGKKRKAQPMAAASTTKTTSTGRITTTFAGGGGVGGVDTLFTIQGRPLAVGESVRFILIKGPSTSEMEDSGDGNEKKMLISYKP